jgi:membrane protease YdiL (CAAX protease family)
LALSSLILIPSLAMLATARAFSLDRNDLHLGRGDMRAPGLIPGTHRYVSWTLLGPAATTAFLVGGAAWVWSAAHPSTSDGALVLSWLPAALLFAVINPAQEEIRFRVVPLATLAPAVGDEAAIWMTSAVFGLARWSEATPSGPIGLVFHGLVGALLAKSILETRGVAWAWIIHAAGNLVLFIGLVLDAN